MGWLPFLHGSQSDSRIRTEALGMNLDPLGHSACHQEVRTIPRLASNIPHIKCFTGPNQTLKSESSCPLNSSRGLTASFNFLVQRNWNSSWVLCMAVMILAINCWQRDNAPHPSRFWLELRRESYPASKAWERPRPSKSLDDPSDLGWIIQKRPRDSVCMRFKDMVHLCYEPLPHPCPMENNLDLNPLFNTTIYSASFILLRPVSGKSQSHPKHLRVSTKAFKNC